MQMIFREQLQLCPWFLKMNIFTFPMVPMKEPGAVYAGGKIMKVKKDGTEAEIVAGMDGLRAPVFPSVKMVMVVSQSIDEMYDYINSMDKYFTRNGSIYFMNENGEFTDRDLVLELYFKVRDFLNIHDRLDDRYRDLRKAFGGWSFMVKLMCMDPSECLRRCLDQSESTVFFSATLLPVQYYKELLSGDPQEYAIYAKSPFSPENVWCLRRRM